MADVYEHFGFHAATDQPVEDTGPTMRGVGGPDDRAVAHSVSNEMAARIHLDRLMAADDRPTLRGMRGPSTEDPAPDLAFASELRTPLDTQLVTFTQTRDAIPVFGSKAVVEMTPDQRLVSAGGAMADVGGINPQPSLTEEDAVAAVAGATGTTAGGDELTEAELTFFRDPTDDGSTWHLAWLVRGYPAAPEGIEPAEHHGSAPSMRTLYPVYDYLVDAHSGELLYAYSAAPTVSPVRLVGLDEADGRQQLWGAQVDDGFALDDTLFRVVTYDLALADVGESQFPDQPVVSEAADLADRHRAAVTAHVNARRVKDFLNTVLGRNSIDGEGMELVSVVNCTLADRGGGRSDEWENAVWWKDRMWYGQVRDGDRLVSLARHLDIIAHELVHGVTERTSDLVYRDQSGALNESFSDIFGVIVKNWFLAPDRDDVATWDWELGTGWNGGTPLRDLSDPTRTGDPDHMDDYDDDPSNRDHGGVHTNSNIHNLVAYRVLTSRDGDGDRVLSVTEASVLFYLTLLRLAKQATFNQSRDAMVQTVRTMFAGDETARERAVEAIEAAFEAVGIA